MIPNNEIKNSELIDFIINEENNSKAKVSVIVPVYNGSKFLKDSIESLINQTLKDIEIIYVNDCSTDDSFNILLEYAKNDSRIKIINLKKNQGQSKAKNISIDIASADYLMFCDHDDWLEKDACELCYNQITKNNNDLVMFDFNRHYETGEVKQERIRIDALKEYLEYPNIRLYETNTNFFKSGYAWCYIYKKEFLNKYNIRFPENYRFVDDVPFIMKALVLADNISIIENPLYNHIENPESITYKRPDLWVERFSARDEVLEYIQKSTRRNEYTYPFITYYIETMLYWLRKYIPDTKINVKIKKAYYKKLKERFTYLNNNYDINKIIDSFSYKHFSRVINYGYYRYIIGECLKNLFCIYNKYNSNNKYKIIKIMGKQISIKLR